MSEPYSAIPANSLDSSRDAQDRMGRFARLIFAIAGSMLLAIVVLETVLGRRNMNPGRVVHAAALVVLLAGWRRCKGKTMPAPTLGAVDAALTIVTCTAWAMLGVGAPPEAGIDASVVLATTTTLVARSVMVPSSFHRSLAIGAASVVPTVIFFLSKAVMAPGATDALIGKVLFATLWCIVAVVTSALNSRQIFGLRERIREVGKLGQYTLQERIGQGGMGVVYRATHAMLRRPAAIKLLPPDRAGDNDLVRFEREVQLTSRLTHPNTISIFDYGRTAEGVFYYVMELLDGFDLERLVEDEGAIEPARVIHILAQASGALAEAHALGLIHRDIKPANIMLTERADAPDVVKVVDFGLVRTLAGGVATDLNVTNVNAITGTPMYLSPEAITTPDTVDARSDIYALGAVGYFLLTGHPVFEAKTVVEVCSMHLHSSPIAPADRLGQPISDDLARLILACLAKRPEDRPPSADALQAALRECADASRYDAPAAREWWRSRGPTLRTRRTHQWSGIGSAPTMAIDFRGRGTPFR